MNLDEFKEGWCLVDGVVEKVIVYDVQYVNGDEASANILVPRRRITLEVPTESLYKIREHALGKASRELLKEASRLLAKVSLDNLRVKHTFAEHQYHIDQNDFAAALGSARVLALQAEHAAHNLERLFEINREIELLKEGGDAK